MSSLWIAAIVLAAGPNDVAPSPGLQSAPATAAVDQPAVPLRTGNELRDATRDALAKWARATDKEADLAARQFLVLYDELMRDTEMSSAVRDPLRNKVRGRLMKLSDQIRKRVAIEKRLAKQKKPESVDAAANDNPVLAQFGGGMARPGMGGGMMAPGRGGGAMLGGGNAWQNGPPDNGEQLVELIQQVIAPATWDVNGGPGSIYYWRIGHSMVISAPGEVHHEIGGVLDQLRRAGQ